MVHTSFLVLRHAALISAQDADRINACMEQWPLIEEFTGTVRHYTSDSNWEERTWRLLSGPFFNVRQADFHLRAWRKRNPSAPGAKWWVSDVAPLAQPDGKVTLLRSGMCDQQEMDAVDEILDGLSINMTDHAPSVSLGEPHQTVLAANRAQQVALDAELLRAGLQRTVCPEPQPLTVLSPSERGSARTQAVIAAGFYSYVDRHGKMIALRKGLTRNGLQVDMRRAAILPVRGRPALITMVVTSEHHPVRTAKEIMRQVAAGAELETTFFEYGER